MTSSFIFYFIVALSVLAYLFDQYLDYLNYKARRKDIPAEIAGFYDATKYQKSLDYQQAQSKFSFVTSGFSFILSTTMLVFGGFGYLDRLLRAYIHSEIALALAFFAVIFIVLDILTLPFQWHSTFVIEERFGFNKTTPKTFFLDKLKGYAIGAIAGGSLLAILIFLIQQIGPAFWLWFGAIAAVVILFINVFYTSLILPLFNKLTPLPTGDLRKKIEDFSVKVDFPLNNVLVMDGSKRSKKSNAFFSGMGRRKKIVLYDTLVLNHTPDELVAVLAHEIGHYKKKHVVVGLLLAILQVFFTLFVLSLMVFDRNVSLALGGSQQSIHLNLLAFGILYSPISGIAALLMNLYSRKNEFEADEYASKTFNGLALSNALKKLSVDNLSNLYPHPWYVFFHYSHPPLLQRLSALEVTEKS